MKKLNFKEIIEILEENYDISSFAYDELSDLKEDSSFTESYNEYYKKHKWDGLREFILKGIGLGNVEEVDQYGGEDCGSTWYSIKHFKDHDIYIRTDGYYQSHYGTDFHDGFGKEVKPTEKTITVYE